MQFIGKMKSLVANNMYNTVVIMAAVAAFAMLVPGVAYAEGKLNGVLSGIGTIAGIIGAIAMICMLVRHIFEFVKGDGSIGKIIINVVILLAFLALIGVATNVSTLQNVFGGAANGALDVVSDAADTALSTGGNS